MALLTRGRQQKAERCLRGVVNLTDSSSMAHPQLRHPSLESSSTQPSLDGHRPSLFDAKDAFIERMGPIGVAAIYFGPFSLAPQDPALSRQALLKLSFAYRQYLQPAGVRYHVQKQTVTVSGTIRSRSMAILAEKALSPLGGEGEKAAQLTANFISLIASELETVPPLRRVE